MGREIKPRVLMPCDTIGCLSYAEFWCAWGCLEGHIADGKYCLNCMVSKKTRAHGMASRMKCGYMHSIMEFFYSSVTDKYHKIIEA